MKEGRNKKEMGRREGWQTKQLQEEGKKDDERKEGGKERKKELKGRKDVKELRSKEGKGR